MRRRIPNSLLGTKSRFFSSLRMTTLKVGFDSCNSPVMSKHILLCISLCLAIPGLIAGQRLARGNALAPIAILEDERAIDTAAVSGWIRNPDPMVRCRVAYMIGIVGDTSYRVQLSELLTDESREVVLSAIFAAGQLADSAFTDPLIRYSADGDSAIKARAIEALSKVSSSRAVNQLMGILADSLERPHFRALVAESMHRLKDKESLRALIDQSGNSDDLIRLGAFYAMSRRADPLMPAAFAEGLRDSTERIRIYSLIGVGKINDTTSVSLVRPLLQKGSWRQKYYALSAIGKLKARGLADQVSKLLRQSEHVYVRQAAIKALGDIGDVKASDELLPLLDDADIDISVEALIAIAKVKKDEAATQITRFAESDNPRKRAAAASACEFVSSSERIQTLERLSKDGNAFVRSSAFEQLLGLDSVDVWKKYVPQAMSDTDLVPVTLACNHIANKRHYESLPMVGMQYKFGSSDDAKAATLDCLLEFGDSLPRSYGYAQIAGWALQSKDYSMRRRGAKLAYAERMEFERRDDHYDSDITRDNYDQIYATVGANPVAEIKTVKGAIHIELLRAAAPKTVANFVKLAKKGFYNKRVWHRVVPDFVIQDGCPRGDGWGGPGYEIRCEYNDLPYLPGSVGMATSGKDTGGSQYFICQSPQPHLNGRYTLFGQVIAGMDVVDRIEAGDAVLSVTIIDHKE